MQARAQFHEGEFHENVRDDNKKIIFTNVNSTKSSEPDGIHSSLLNMLYSVIF